MTKRRSSTESSPSHPLKRPNLNKSILQNVSEAIDDAISQIDSGIIGDDEIIRDSVAMLCNLQELYVTLCAARATAFDREGKLDKAMVEASRAIKARPSSPRGYLVSGELYMKQGHHKSAVEVLEDGLRTALPSDWPALYHKREEARRSMESKVDFISKLPSEVVSHIFSYVSYNSYHENLGDLVTCSAVSKSWRASVLQCSKAWEVAYYGDYDAWFQPTLLFQSVNSFINELHYSVNDDEMAVQLLGMASSGMLPSVHKLIITPMISSGRVIEQHTSLISALGKQLTELIINVGVYDDFEEEEEEITARYPLDLILTMCPNLKRLGLRDDAARFTSLHPSARYPLSLNLEFIDIEHGQSNLSIFKWLIPRSPRLRHLYASRFPTELLPLVDQHCPELKKLAIPEHYFDLHRQPKNHEEQLGLQRIVCAFESRQERVSMRNLAPFFLKSKNALEVVDLDVKNQAATAMEGFWDPIATVQYVRLTHLNLKFDKAASKGAGTGVFNFLRQCPMLESVYVNIHGPVTANFFTSFIDMPHLRDLAIFNIQSDGGLIQFLKHHSALGQRSPLQILGVNYCEKITDNILDAIADITTLTIIHFRGELPLVTSSGLDKFLYKVARNANLKTLMMHNTKCLKYRMSAGEKLASINNMTRKYYKDTQTWSLDLVRKN